MKQIAAIALLMSIFWAGAARTDDSVYPDRPVEVRMTGMLLPIEEQGREDLVTVSIFVQDKPRLLRVGKVGELTATERERAARQNILLRQVRFYGPDALISRLQDPQIVGKVLRSKGGSIPSKGGFWSRPCRKPPAAPLRPQSTGDAVPHSCGELEQFALACVLGARPSWSPFKAGGTPALPGKGTSD